MVVTWLRAGAVSLVLGLAAISAAEVPLDARISATALRQWRPADGLQVRPGEVSDLAEAIADAFRAEVDRRGWPRGEAAPALLQFRYGAAVERSDGNRSGIELRGGLGSAGNDEAEVLLRLDLTQRRAGKPEIRSRVMLITVSNRHSEVLWQGRLEATIGDEDELALAGALVPYVLDYLGRDAFNEPLR